MEGSKGPPGLGLTCQPQVYPVHGVTDDHSDLPGVPFGPGRPA